MTTMALQAKVGLTRNMRELAAIARQERLLGIGTHGFYFEERSASLLSQTGKADRPYLVERDGERALVFSRHVEEKGGSGDFAGGQYPLGHVGSGESPFYRGYPVFIIYEVKTASGAILFSCHVTSWNKGRIEKARELPRYLEVRAAEAEFISEFQKLNGNMMILSIVPYGAASVILHGAGVTVPPQTVFLSVAGEIVKAYAEIGKALKESAGILSFGGYENVCLKRTRDQIRNEMKSGSFFMTVPILENRSLIF